MEKLKKTAKGLDVVCKVLFWCLIAGIAACVIGLITVLCVNSEAFSNEIASSSIVLGNGIMFTFPEDVLVDIDFRPFLAASLASAVVICSIFVYALKVIRNMLRPMKEGAPFNSAVSSGFHRLGWFTIIVGIITNLFDLLGKTALVNMLSPSVREACTVSVQDGFSLNFILIAFLLFLLSYVFRYGEELQRLSDETL